MSDGKVTETVLPIGFDILRHLIGVRRMPDLEDLRLVEMAGKPATHIGFE